MPPMNEAHAPKVQFVEIDEGRAGQRLDNFLLSHLKGVPKTRIYRLLRKGEIRVNKGRAKPAQRLAVGDVIRIAPIRVAERDAPPQAGEGLLSLLEGAILYEDKALIILNKPSGLAVHGGSGISLGLIESLRQLRPQEKFLELVHRLDRDTSGCIMVAKKRSMLRHLHTEIRENRVDKIYHALVAGRWPNRKKQVDVPLRKNELQSGERMVRVDADGKPSLTEFKVLNRYREATLVEAKPITGRTHQIRVHAQFAGHPLIGDEKYGLDELNKAMRKLGLKRLFLHAARLRVRLPEQAEPLDIEAPLSPELQAGLKNLLSHQSRENEVN